MRSSVAIALMIGIAVVAFAAGYASAGGRLAAGLSGASGSNLPSANLLTGGGSCLYFGESFTRVEGFRIKAKGDGDTKILIAAPEIQVRKAPRPYHPTGEGAAFHQCVVRKVGTPDPDVLMMHRYDEGSAITPRGQELIVRNYDVDHWALWASHGLFTIDVRWE